MTAFATAAIIGFITYHIASTGACLGPVQPFQVAVHALSAANRGDFDAASMPLDEELFSAHENLKNPAALRSWWNYFTRGRTVSEFRIADQKVSPPRAYVDLLVSYDIGLTQTLRFSMIQRAGRWRITDMRFIGDDGES